MEQSMRKMKGTLLLWIDVELGWARVHRKRINLKRLKRASMNLRETFDAVIGVLDKYRMPVTWTILGHLLLDHCNKDANQLPHSDMPRPNYSWLNDDWYRHDPCTDVQRDPTWYGKDIVDKIIKYAKNSKMSHDIGCHSFSHQLFGDPGCSEELARAEIDKCIELMKKEYGIVPRVFSFPRDYVGHVNVLKESGLIAYRGAPTKLYPCLELERTVSNFVKTQFSLFTQLLSYYLLIRPHITGAEESLPGLWTVQGCLAYGKKRLIPLRLVTLKAKNGIDKAAKEKKIFSMYTHLRDFGENSRMLSHFEEVLSYANRKRKEGLLEVKTMTQLVKDLSFPKEKRNGHKSPATIGLHT